MHTHVNSWYFVYGTLLRGMCNHHLIAGEIVRLVPARTSGTLYHLPQGYPMLLREEHGTVFGEAVLLRAKPGLLAALDELEDFIEPGHPDNLYERVWQKVYTTENEIIQAQVYVCPPHRLEIVKKTGIPVSGGDWRNFPK